jgi:hypothetical protein
MENETNDLLKVTQINLKKHLEKLGDNPTTEQVNAAADQLLKECIAAMKIATGQQEKKD